METQGPQATNPPISRTATSNSVPTPLLPRPTSPPSGPEFQILNDIPTGDRTVITLKNVQQIIPLARVNFKNQVNHLSWSSDSSLFAIATNSQGVFVYSTDLTLQRTIKADGYAVSFSPKDQLLVYSTISGKKLEITDRASNEAYTELEFDEQLEGIVFSPDGSVMATGHKGHKVVFWETSTWEKIGQIRYPSPIAFPTSAMGFSPDGRFLYVGFGRILVVIDAQSFRIVSEDRSAQSNIYSLDVTPDGNQIVTGLAGPLITFWSASDSMPGISYDGRILNSDPYQVRLSKNGDVLFVGDSLSNLLALSMQRPEILASFSAHDGTIYLADLSVSHDGTLIATASNDKSVVIWGIGP